jgi:hypothetical protein
VKTIDLTGKVPTVEEILELARADNIILRTREGREFLLAEIDDLTQEVALMRSHEELMRYLEHRSTEGGRYTLSQVKESLGIG